ncbi:curli production assembly/transport protein CsgE [Paralcaligenes ureilyticus]|uniref:Curli production assembly/transport component CsgE n=1 Tax=Paralcaligenes ureilyticus TaxID=627131 RepID=A0A4R3ME56_9BURK|nr:curli production assembly/transport protein CsgE [Paralcaligenes ureilyticus]TCT10427.1 curli production assembly/transport component CsgE [Paralcaligenes ureilyticus]
MQLTIKKLSALIFLIVTPVAYSKSLPPAADSQSLDHGSLSDEPLAGVVINRTVTVLGWDFYQNFAAIWRAKFADSRYTVSVHERPTAQFGSEMWVEYKQKRMFHAFLAPARSATKPVAAAAVDMVYKNIIDSNVQSLLFTDVDLAPEEM